MPEGVTLNRSMAYQARVLPADEWQAKLADREPFTTIGFPDPQTAFIVVVEQDGAVVASWIAVDFAHLEGFWSDPAVRHHPGVQRRLFETMMAELTSRGVGVVFTIAQEETIRSMAERVGFTAVPGTLMGLQLCPSPPR